MKDPLFSTKVAAAVLVTLLLFFGIPILIDTFVTGEGHEIHYKGEDHTDPDNPFGFKGYPVAVAVAGGPAKAPKVEKDLGTLLAEASAKKGQSRAIICTGCHTLDKGGADGTGPHLYGVIGREIGSVPGFGYTTAMKQAGGVWTYEKMDALLKNSQEFMPGTTMAQKFSKPEQRADILAYLATLSDNPLPFPEPAPVEPVETAEAEGHGDDMAEAASDANDFIGDAINASETVEDMVDSGGQAH